MNIEERVKNMLASVTRGNSSQHEVYMYFVLDAEKYPLRDIWAAIPIQEQENFKRWIIKHSSNDELEFITNNYTVRPITIVRAYRDFLEGKIAGDQLVTGAEWHVRGNK